MPEPSQEPINVNNTEKISIQNSETAPQQNEPKIWSIDDPFQYAPAKPNGDPWSILLEPLIKKDKLRCESWKDEVQNLLIFAGLFSAVVTAFIVESYKGLQPDPNDTIINILSHIATRLDNSGNNISTFSSEPLPSFSPPAPTIRVNALWFISLVLSLATVLVGIISLQWLREHLSYPDDSPRYNFALYHMRNEGLERWHVSKVFTALPLLLQCALVLFLAGLVDFLQAFHVLAILIPVSIVVGLTLLFLAFTTFLPALQVLSLYFLSSTPRQKRPPSQCPYKSPQSHAIRTLCFPIFILFDNSYSFLRTYLHRFLNFVKGVLKMTPIPPLEDDGFTWYIRCTCYSQTWSFFDENWILLRDAYMRRALDRPLDNLILDYRTKSNLFVLPIYDIVTSLHCRYSDNASSHAAYHAFVEICDLTLLPMNPDSQFFSPDVRGYFNQNAYLQAIITPPWRKDSCLADFYTVDAKIFRYSAEWKTFTLALKQQSIFSFLNDADNTDLLIHKDEVNTRLIQYFYKGTYEMRSGKPKVYTPLCFNLAKTGSWRPGRDAYSEEYNAIVLQIIHMASDLLRNIDNTSRSHGQLEILSSRSRLLACAINSMKEMYFITIHILFNTNAYPRLDSDSDNALRAAFNSLVGIINETLERDISNRLPTDGRPNLLFYATASFMYLLRPTFRLPGFAFDALYSTLYRYKRHTIDLGITDNTLEQQLVPTLIDIRAEFSGTIGLPIFSESWWKDFENLNDRSGSDVSLRLADNSGIRTTPAAPSAISTKSLRSHSSSYSTKSTNSNLNPPNCGTGTIAHNSMDFIPHLHPGNHFSQSPQGPPNVEESSSLRSVRTNDELV